MADLKQVSSPSPGNLKSLHLQNETENTVSFIQIIAMKHSWHFCVSGTVLTRRVKK